MQIKTNIVIFVSAENEFLAPPNFICGCPGQVLTYNCTVDGTRGMATLWSGTAFNCSGNANEIILRHNKFNGTSKACNQGAITAQSVGAQDNMYFTSQLQVTVSSGLNNKTVECSVVNSNVTVGEAQIRVVQGMSKCCCVRYTSIKTLVKLLVT